MIGFGRCLRRKIGKLSQLEMSETGWEEELTLDKPTPSSQYNATFGESKETIYYQLFKYFRRWSSNAIICDRRMKLNATLPHWHTEPIRYSVRVSKSNAMRTSRAMLRKISKVNHVLLLLPSV